MGGGVSEKTAADPSGVDPSGVDPSGVDGGTVHDALKYRIGE